MIFCGEHYYKHEYPCEQKGSDSFPRISRTAPLRLEVKDVREEKRDAGDKVKQNVAAIEDAAGGRVKMP